MSFEQVQEREKRLAQMHQQIADLTAEADTLGTEVAVTLAAGQDAAKARTRRAEVRQLRTDLTEAATLLGHQIATDREAAGYAEAKKRQTGIARAFGSMRQELDDDEAKVREAAVAYRAMVERLNERFRALTLLRAEAEALRDRFGIEVPALPVVVAPGRREGCVAALMAVASATFLDRGYRPPETEACEYGLRQRRTYAEIAGTPGAEIIEAVGGPKAWPELTAKQAAIVASRAESQAAAAEAMREFAAYAPGERRRHAL